MAKKRKIKRKKKSKKNKNNWFVWFLVIGVIAVVGITLLILKTPGWVTPEVFEEGASFYSDSRPEIEDSASSSEVIPRDAVTIDEETAPVVPQKDPDEKVESSEEVTIQNCETETAFRTQMYEGIFAEPVNDLQELLKCLGYLAEDIEATTYFGALTTTAVIKFQEDNDIDPNGVVGPKTSEVLNKLYYKGTPVDYIEAVAPVPLAPVVDKSAVEETEKPVTEKEEPVVETVKPKDTVSDPPELFFPETGIQAFPE